MFELAKTKEHGLAGWASGNHFDYGVGLGRHHLEGERQGMLRRRGTDLVRECPARFLAGW